MTFALLNSILIYTQSHICIHQHSQWTTHHSTDMHVYIYTLHSKTYEHLQFRWQLSVQVRCLLNRGVEGILVLDLNICLLVHKSQVSAKKGFTVMCAHRFSWIQFVTCKVVMHRSYEENSCALCCVKYSISYFPEHNTYHWFENTHEKVIHSLILHPNLLKLFDYKGL